MSTTTCSLQLRIGVNPEIVRLVQQTAMALSWAELDEASETVVDRLMCSGRLLEAEPISGGVMIQLKPFAELALMETRDIAGCNGLDDSTKVRKIRQILNLAGY